MNEIIQTISDYIDAWVTDNVSQSPLAVKSWGFAELANRTSKGKTSTSTQPIPVTVNGTGQREQIAIDDRYDFISWIRLNSPVSMVLSDEDTWGLVEGKRLQLSLRIVIAHKVELGENLAFNLADALPPNMVLSGFDFVFLNTEGSVDTDHELIYVTELGNTVYEQHRFNWNIYVLNLGIEYKRCIGFVPGGEFIEDEFGDCLTV